MNLAVISSLCALALLTPHSVARTFTNTEGKSIEAQIVSATDKDVTLKLPSGKTSTVLLSNLSHADQDHVKSWIEEKVPDVRVTPNFVRSNRDTNKELDEGGGFRKRFDDKERGGRQVQVLELNVELETWDKARGVEGQLRYILVGRSLETRGQYKILAVQTEDFNLPPGGDTTVEFTKVENFYEDGQNRGRGARCVGYVLYATRKSDGREIHASASSPILKDAIHSIISLPAGEVTDDSFIKIPTGKPGKKRDAAIRVK